MAKHGILHRPASVVAAAASVLALAAALVAGGALLAHQPAAQAATTTSCPAPTTSNLPCVKSGFKDGPVSLPPGATTVAKLPLPAGKWAISAKLSADSGAVYAQFGDTITCKLVAGIDLDTTEATLPPNSINGQDFTTYQSVALNVVHAFSSAGSAVLQCQGQDGNEEVRMIKITAVKAGTLINIPLS